ncbi:nitroreductase family protein [Microbacterium sp. GXF6406]
MSTSIIERTASTSVPVISAIAERWSPRAFDAETTIDEGKLAAALEAARWAPSAYNSQPWRFAVARRGTELHAAIVETLVSFNQIWAPSAGALVVAIAENAAADGTPISHAAYDLGQAVAGFAVQAQEEGLSVHQMSGFDAAAMSEVLGLEERFTPFTVIAVGHLGDASVLPEALQERENAPRERRSLAETLIANV